MNENENVQTTQSEDITPQIEESNENDAQVGQDEALTPKEVTLTETDTTRDAVVSAQGTASEKADRANAFVSVQYNHKTRELSKDEAVNLIQKGMHTEVLRNKLEYLANVYKTDVNSLVNEMVSAPEKAHRKHLERLYGKDSADVEIGMKIYREKQSEEYKKMLNEYEKQASAEKEIKDVNSRLADEYLALKTELPNAPQYSELPDSVIIEAANGKRDLLSSYLCYLQKEKTKIEASQISQQVAKDASSKSMKSDGGDNINSHERSFLSGLWSK